MTTDRTQHQSTEAAERAQRLSLAATRPPAEVPGYDLQRLLGRGAYGEVWVGVDRNTGRRVAIKFFFHHSGVDWTLLSREVEKLVYLSADRNVVQLLQVGWDAEPPFYVMEYVENGSLDDYLRHIGTLTVEVATSIFRDLAVGLVHAHGKGVLHCDLKPANVLLDQDLRPRLADFGQSRLSHEQSPALGTLFYMAPEQADLQAVPDARWDVYALGAIFYRMVTGEPPFRSEPLLQKIEQASNLTERLAAYHQLIQHSPPPTNHRQVAGMDRALVDIIDRCLAVHPDRRFANVQAVLDALASRDTSRHRRLLLMSGFLGPLLLLAVMTLFGLRGYEYAIRDSEEFVNLRVKDGNEFAAKFAARSIEGEIARYFRVVRNEAESVELLQRFLTVAESPLVQELNDPQRTPKEVAHLRPQFLENADRVALNDYLDQRLRYYLDRLNADPRELKFASLLALDGQGRMLGAAYDSEVDTQSVGWSFAYRSYFHGGAADFDGSKEANPTAPVRPISGTHLSAAFLSTSTGTWKVAVSTPIYRSTGPEREVCGVLAVTINLGDFAYFRGNKRKDRFAVLIDGRSGPNFGVILQHPLLDQLNHEPNLRQEDFTSPKYRVTEAELQRLRTDPRYRYTDPMAKVAGNAEFAGDWIAAVEWVRLPEVPDIHPDMIVLVQERFSEATAPVKELGRRLKREGLWAVGGVVGVVLVLWYVVIRVLGQTPPIVHGTRDPRKLAGTPSTTTQS